MKRPRVLVMIDQACRDAFSQLLTIRYLERKGVRVLVCNQHSLVAMCERYRPQVVYASWLVGGPIIDYLHRAPRAMRIVLIDQEGGRIGEEPFKRSFTLLNGIKAEIAKRCARIFMWGPAQAAWLQDLRVLPRERIVVTGSPRFDPYLVDRPPARRSYLGVTLRGDALTSMPATLIEDIYYYGTSDEPDRMSVGYPIGAHYEDRLWHVAAATRCLFKMADRFARQSRAPIVFRPGPWEQCRQYAFLPREIPSARVEFSRPQHEYVRNAFALLEESSSMGLEGLLAGVPVISVQQLIPRLAEHIRGPGKGFFDAPYMRCYWKPASGEEAVGLLVKAEQGRVDASPDPDMARQYFQECHGWPRTRPSSFEIGDRLLECVDGPRRADASLDEASAPAGANRLKRSVYRYVPGSTQLLKAKVVCQHALSPYRQRWFRYHYFETFYPHRLAVRDMFESLWNTYEVRSAGVPSEHGAKPI